MSLLKGQVALVTGASAPLGIGRAICERLAREGAFVVCTDVAGPAMRNGESIERMDLLADLVRHIEKEGGTAQHFALDVTRGEDVSRFVEQILYEHGRLDILVNNAGSLAGSDWFMNTTPEEWGSSFEVNLLGPMRLAQAAIPAMQAQGGGRIINIGSTASLGAEPGFGAYTAMKQGLVGFTKTLAAEFGKDGILCNCVCPGYIATDMHLAANRRLAAEQGVSLEEIKAQRYAPVALQEAGHPSDVADAVAYLAGPQSRYVTGITLPVTGGVPAGI